MKSLGFLVKTGDQRSKTAFFATLCSLLVLGFFPFVALGKATYPPITSELLMIFWGTYIGSNKATQWIEAAKGTGPAVPCPPPEPVKPPVDAQGQPIS